MSKALVLILVLAFASLAFSASCAKDAYDKACASCSFTNGKIDRSCSDGYKASGTACVSTSYPVMAGRYATGGCPALDSCASDLSSCIAQYSSGNDSADCQEGSVAVCYAAADECTKQAAIKCGEIKSPCAAPGGFLLLFAGLAFVKINGRA
jgi:hypothetical protein